MIVPRFVIQEHHARTFHHDFRLERDGVLKSWAIPKGIPERAGEKRLAIQVEDHSLDFGDFEGTIPEGEYGAGEVATLDRGSYDVQEWLEDRIVVTLNGLRVKGTYVLVRFPKQGDNAWLLLRQSAEDS